MDHYDFKPRVPVDHVRHIISSVREGVPKKGQLLMCVGSASGEVGALIDTFENPDVVPIGSPTITSMEEQELLRELEDALNDYNPEAAQISPFLLALIMKAIELALEYLNNR